MLIEIPALLSAAQVEDARAALNGATWTDGRGTAGYLSARVKDNQQLAEDDPVARRLGGMILDVLDRHQTFIAAALPLKVLPPLFNRYAGGHAYGAHVDGAVRPAPGTPHRVRTDVSATLFLSDPATYDGGELIVEDAFGPRSVKLAAGSMVLYPGTSVHSVAPVTRGARLAAFFWVQSMVRDDAQRAILFDLDRSIQELARAGEESPAMTRLAGVYHNLLRRWGDV